MLYNIGLFSKNKNIVYQYLKGYDGRPLTFTEYAYAEREVFEINTRLNLPDEDGLIYIVVKVEKWLKF